MKIIIDADACIGCGLCAQVAPDIYEMQQDKAVPIRSGMQDGRKEEAENAAEQCPVNAISVS